jgi:hypothetical protein
MRPTIPLSDWRLAVDLDAARSIRRQTGHPAEGCACRACTTWRELAEQVFPKPLAAELERLGIDITNPTDLYIFGETTDALDFRVMYHIAGKILSGPAAWLDERVLDDALDSKMHYYHQVQSEPAYVGLRVSTKRNSFEYAPEQPSETRSDILCLDFRLRAKAAV